MAHQRHLQLRTLLGSLSLLVLAVGCMARTTSPSAHTAPTPVMVVTIDTILADPARYAHAVLNIQGYFAGGIARPTCAGWIGSPTDWRLASALRDQALPAPLILEIQNAFPSGVLPTFAPAAYQKQMLLYGRLRLYNGPVGCGRIDAQGNYHYDQVPQVQIWYLEAVQLQSEVPIKWRQPRDPTPQPHYRPTDTPTMP